MPKREYMESLTDKDRLRIQLTTRQGEITKFIVQYYALIGGKWRTIMRADNCHGYPHRHTYYLHKKEYAVKLDINLSESFNESKSFIKNSFKAIKENYLLR